MAERHTFALLAHGLDAETRNDHLAICIISNDGPVRMHGRSVNGRDPYPFDFAEVYATAVPDLKMIGKILTGDEQIGLEGGNDNNECSPNILSRERPDMEGYSRRGPASVGQ